jgi:hypothetical protein
VKDLTTGALALASTDDAGSKGDGGSVIRRSPDHVFHDTATLGPSGSKEPITVPRSFSL